MNKWLKWLLILFLLAVDANMVQAYDIVVQLRFYQGFYENGENHGVIVSSYYLQKEPDNNTPYIKMEEETESIKHIYKLKKVEQVTRMSVVLKGDRQDSQSHQIKLNGRELWLGLKTIPEMRDRFGISISEKDKKKNPMLNSEIIVPEGKAAVLGFKDSQDKIFFLAFNRKAKEQTMAERLGAKSIETPKLIKYIEPEYPQEALKKQITGEVVIVGQTDLEGHIRKVEVLKGHPLLVEATKKALSQWIYSVWKVDGIKKPLDFSMVFIFILKGKSGVELEESDREILDRCRPLLKSKKYDKILPRILELISITGNLSHDKPEDSN